MNKTSSDDIEENKDGLLHGRKLESPVADWKWDCKHLIFQTINFIEHPGVHNDFFMDTLTFTPDFHQLEDLFGVCLALGEGKYSVVLNTSEAQIKWDTMDVKNI